MSFDVVRFLEDYNVQYWTAGENVSRGRVGVTCPFCNDTYNHLGLDKQGQKVPYCWKCGSHSWWDYIRTITNEDPRDVISKYGTLMSFTQAYEPPKQLAIKCVPPGDYNFKNVHYNYLKKRGFDAEYVVNKYDMRVTSMHHDYAHRIIIPIVKNGRIVSYQGRSYIDATPKYLTCRPEDEVIFHKDIFFNLDNAKQDAVILVEGIFDAIRLGNNTIASFGTSVTTSQIQLLIHTYKTVFVLFDGELQAQTKAHALSELLSHAGLSVENIVLDSGDPGDMKTDDALHLKKELHLL
jgi:hypothetical protein